jgi:hypothetical protein
VTSSRRFNAAVAIIAVAFAIVMAVAISAAATRAGEIRQVAVRALSERIELFCDTVREHPEAARVEDWMAYKRECKR